MRRCSIVLVAVAAVAAVAAAPTAYHKIVFARVFPNAGQLGVFIAAADGSDERLLLASPDVDYDPVWSPDGSSIVFTSERNGSADLYRVKPDGSGVEQLTESPSYDDQAAFSPDGSQLVFVSTRAGGNCRSVDDGSGHAASEDAGQSQGIARRRQRYTARVDRQASSWQRPVPIGRTSYITTIGAAFSRRNGLREATRSCLGSAVSTRSTTAFTDCF